MTQTQINMSIAVNAAKIRREKREGRDTIIVPSYAAKADSVLNGILYSRAELDKSIGLLNRTPAPLGHPTIGGKFVPAMDPEALARNHVFAWNENPRWDGDRIALDVVIDASRAGESADGARVLNAIYKGEPISTSTGLLCILDAANAKEYKSSARDIAWDHVAILLDEVPAIGTDQGVGMLVNKAVAKDGTEIDVINSAMDDAERELDWAVDSVIRAAERVARVPLLERAKSVILELFRGAEQVSSINAKETAMPVTDEQFKALSDEVKTLADGMKGVGDTLTNAIKEAVAPLVAANEALTNAAKAKDDAELADLRGKIVKANLLDEATAGELTLNAARALATKATPGKAMALNGAFTANTDAPAFKLPKAEGK